MINLKPGNASGNYIFNGVTALRQQITISSGQVIGPARIVSFQNVNSDHWLSLQKEDDEAFLQLECLDQVEDEEENAE